MANNDFKTAAAKLLAQHSAKKKGTPSPAHPEKQQAHIEQQQVSPAMHNNYRSMGSAGSELRSLLKGTAIPVLATLGCIIMVFLVPETIFGMWFNGIFGIAAGALFGFIIIRQL